MNIGIGEGASSGGGVIDARLLQSDWDPGGCHSGVPRWEISWITRNSQLVKQLFPYKMPTFISFTGISQLLEATTDLLWRPRLARSLIYIIWYESIPHRKASRLLSSWSYCFLLVFFQSYKEICYYSLYSVFGDKHLRLMLLPCWTIRKIQEESDLSFKIKIKMLTIMAAKQPLLCLSGSSSSSYQWLQLVQRRGFFPPAKAYKRVRRQLSTCR